jgi:acetamidase/formamidase
MQCCNFRRNLFGPIPLSALVSIAVFLAHGQSLAAAASIFSGTWEVSWVRLGETNSARMQLEQTSGKINGKGFNGTALEGTATDDSLEIRLLGEDKTKTEATLIGKLSEGKILGNLKQEKDEFPLVARRALQRPKDAPKRHEFTPTQFHRYFSASIPPALRVWQGDTIHTETVDAGGFDKAGVRRSRGGNPLTGPFFIEGALGGDTLVVHLKRIRLNRDTAMSGSSISAIALDPWYKPKPVDGFDSKWKLDREAGVASLANPTEKLKNFRVPLRPFLGCVGVAPPATQSFLSGELGPYGGNMDYNQIVEGTTVYLPVFHPGALLFVGDGHAAQGDGELTGDALETSMEVEITVDLIQGKSFGGPRLENDEYLTALGIANSLPDALQRATTQLSRWIGEDYDLNSSEVAMVLGFAIKYDVAEVVDPHVNVAAKLQKKSIAGLNRATPKP